MIATLGARKIVYLVRIVNFALSWDASIAIAFATERSTVKFVYSLGAGK